MGCQKDTFIVNHENVGSICLTHVSIYIEHDCIFGSCKIGLDFGQYVVDLDADSKFDNSSEILMSARLHEYK